MPTAIAVRKKYVATAGAQFSPKEAQAFGEYLFETLPSRLGRAPTTEDIWRDAQENRRCPYRDYFVWDPKKAHALYLNVQARNLVNHIAEVTVIEGEPRVCRAFFPIQERRGDPKRWIPVETVRENPFMVSQVVEGARRELEYWLDKYSLYSGMNEASDLVRRAVKAIRRKKK